MVVLSEQLAAGIRTEEGNSAVVIHFFVIDYISAWQCQMNVAWISVWAQSVLPGPAVNTHTT